MAWGYYRGGSKKKKTPKAAHWFEKLSALQLKELLAAAGLPVSGSKRKQIERLLESPKTCIYAKEYSQTKRSYSPMSSYEYLSVTDLQNRCRKAGLPHSGGKYDLVIRLLQHDNDTNLKKRAAEDGKEPAAKKARIAPVVPELDGEALAKRVEFRRKKLNKQISTRLDWKPSFKYMNGAIKGAKVDIDCSEPEVFKAIFDGVKESSQGKLSRTFKTDQEVEDAGFYGKSYRYGAHATIKAPASATWSNGKLTFTFKYTVAC